MANSTSTIINYSFHTLLEQILTRYTIEYNFKCQDTQDMIFSPVINRDSGDSERDMGDRSSVVGPRYAILNLKEMVGEKATMAIIHHILEHKDKPNELTNYSIVKMLETECRANLKNIYDTKNTRNSLEDLEREYKLYTQYVEHDGNFKPSVNMCDKIIDKINKIKATEDRQELSEIVNELAKNTVSRHNVYSGLPHINLVALTKFLREDKGAKDKNLYELFEESLKNFRDTDDSLNYLYVDSPKGLYSEEISKEPAFTNPQFTLSTLVNLLKSSGFTKLNEGDKSNFLHYCTEVFSSHGLDKFDIRASLMFSSDFYDFVTFLSNNHELTNLDAVVKILDSAFTKSFYGDNQVMEARKARVLKLLANVAIGGANLKECISKIEAWGDKYFSKDIAGPIMEARLLNSQLIHQSETVMMAQDNFKI